MSLNFSIITVNPFVLWVGQLCRKYPLLGRIIGLTENQRKQSENSMDTDKVSGENKKRKRKGKMLVTSLRVDTLLANASYELDHFKDNYTRQVGRIVFSRTFMALLYNDGKLSAEYVAENRLGEHSCTKSGCWCTEIVHEMIDQIIPGLEIKRNQSTGKYIACTPHPIHFADSKVFAYLEESRKPFLYRLHLCAWMESYKYLGKDLFELNTV